MRQRTDRTGTIVGKLVVESFAHTTPHGDSHWVCRCACGQAVIKPWANLSRGYPVSCGCTHGKETHGQAKRGQKTAIYNLWKGMHNRCSNPNYKQYHDYGGRGITVCDRWADFAAFYADMGDRPAGKTLDRQDNDGPYSPDNCRWATQQEQCETRRPRKAAPFGSVVKVTVS